MTYSMTRLDATTFAVVHAGVVVFSGTMAEAMAEHKRLSLASKPAAVTSARKQARLNQIAERKAAGR